MSTYGFVIGILIVELCWGRNLTAADLVLCTALEKCRWESQGKPTSPDWWQVHVSERLLKNFSPPVLEEMRQ